MNLLFQVLLHVHTCIEFAFAKKQLLVLVSTSTLIFSIEGAFCEICISYTMDLLLLQMLLNFEFAFAKKQLLESTLGFCIERAYCEICNSYTVNLLLLQVPCKFKYAFAKKQLGIYYKILHRRHDQYEVKTKLQICIF